MVQYSIAFDEYTGKMCDLNHMIYYTFKHYTLTASLKSYLKCESFFRNTNDKADYKYRIQCNVVILCPNDS